MRPMPETDWKATAQLMGRKMRQAERALRMAYRKHHLGDESIGWNELSDALKNVLCEFMGDREFQRWTKNPTSRD
jgi:hypothetical protein